MNEPALAKEIFRLVAQRLNREGIQPEDPIVGRIFATLLAGHYAYRGGGTEICADLLSQAEAAMTTADRRLGIDRPRH